LTRSRASSRDAAHTSEPFEDLLQSPRLGCLKALGASIPTPNRLVAFAVPTILGSCGATSATASWGCIVLPTCRSRRLAVGGAQEQLHKRTRPCSHGQRARGVSSSSPPAGPRCAARRAGLRPRSHSTCPPAAPQSASTPLYLDTLGHTGQALRADRARRHPRHALQNLPARERAIHSPALHRGTQPDGDRPAHRHLPDAGLASIAPFACATTHPRASTLRRTIGDRRPSGSNSRPRSRAELSPELIACPPPSRTRRQTFACNSVTNREHLADPHHHHRRRAGDRPPTRHSTT